LNVEIPETLSCWDVKFVADVTPNVVIPETFNCVTDAIPPITLMAVPEFSENAEPPETLDSTFIEFC
jgi:hypothetical protein